MAKVSVEEIRELIKQELPRLVHQDSEIQQMVLRLTRLEFADRRESEDRFTRLLNEMIREREEQARKCDEWDVVSMLLCSVQTAVGSHHYACR